jgi:hypothetical protein
MKICVTAVFLPISICLTAVSQRILQGYTGIDLLNLLRIPLIRLEGDDWFKKTI